MSGERNESQTGRPEDENVVPSGERPPRVTGTDGTDPDHAATPSPIDDDDFFLVLDDLDAEPIAATAATPTDDELGLDGLFDRPAEGSVADEDEFDVLFDGDEAQAATKEFRGTQPAPEFVEDHAGWLGDDVDLAELVGERDAGAAASRAELSDAEEVEEGGDPFLLEEIEVESLDDRDAAIDAADGDDASHTTSGAKRMLAAWEEKPPADDDWSPIEAQAGASPLLGGVEEESAAEGSDVGGARIDWSGAEFTREDEHEATVGGGGVTPQGSGFGVPVAGSEFAERGAAFAEPAPQFVDSAEQEDDPIYGGLAEAQPDAVTTQEGAAATPQAADPDPSTTDVELAATTVDGIAPRLRVVGTSAGSRTWRRRVAAAAVIVVGVGAGILAIEPRWLGLGADAPVVERVEVARPRIDVSLAPPTLPGDTAPTIPTTPPEQPQPDQPTPPVAIDPPIVPIPVIDPPNPPNPPPVDVRPVPPIEPQPPIEVAVPTDTTPRPKVEPNFSPLMIGEYLEIVSPVVESDLTAPGTLPIGTRALALMRNDEIFVGVVRRMDADEVTLDLEPGEVSLAMASLDRIEPLAVAASGEAMEAERGFVRLKNETRFYGRILRDPQTGKIIVQDEGTRITLPRDQVDSFGSAGTSKTHVVFEGDDGWLDQRVRQQLIQFGRGGVRSDPGEKPIETGTRSTETVIPTVSPAPDPGRR
ncbi:MAG: hypothetical protein HZB39_20565 [Planctomycetes bacterium]|nr:hypothetical protein [Planctomycetota bacterium]